MYIIFDIYDPIYQELIIQPLEINFLIQCLYKNVVNGNDSLFVVRAYEVLIFNF